MLSCRDDIQLPSNFVMFGSDETFQLSYFTCFLETVVRNQKENMKEASLINQQQSSDERTHAAIQFPTFLSARNDRRYCAHPPKYVLLELLYACHTMEVLPPLQGLQD